MNSDSYAIARMEVDIAWADVETAATKEELTAACLKWWQARLALRDVLIGADA